MGDRVGPKIRMHHAVHSYLTVVQHVSVSSDAWNRLAYTVGMDSMLREGYHFIRTTVPSRSVQRREEGEIERKRKMEHLSAPLDCC